ncbi:hypothetical protein ACFPM0_04070 [Pseudonocardia sulfidoxydans]|uniref:hypothetical protein n=1 Tax=Pseudonocardia sulfidoxydans TaxID=54011 RepID=UPI0036192D4F
MLRPERTQVSSRKMDGGPNILRSRRGRVHRVSRRRGGRVPLGAERPPVSAPGTVYTTNGEV